MPVKHEKTRCRSRQHGSQRCLRPVAALYRGHEQQRRCQTARHRDGFDARDPSIPSMKLNRLMNQTQATQVARRSTQYGSSPSKRRAASGNRVSPRATAATWAVRRANCGTYLISSIKEIPASTAAAPTMIRVSPSVPVKRARHIQLVRTTPITAIPPPVGTFPLWLERLPGRSTTLYAIRSFSAARTSIQVTRAASSPAIRVTRTASTA